MAERAARFHGEPELLGGVVRHADAGEDDGEAFARPGRRAAARAGRSRARAGRAAGRRAENSGSFCPRTRLFITSMVEMPVSMKSRGSARQAGLIGEALDAPARERGHRRAAVERPADAVENAAEQVRARRRTAAAPGCSRMRVPCRPRPAVDSSTSITIEVSSSAATRPRRGGAVGGRAPRPRSSGRRAPRAARRAAGPRCA